MRIKVGLVKCLALLCAFFVSSLLACNASAFYLDSFSTVKFPSGREDEFSENNIIFYNPEARNNCPTGNITVTGSTASEKVWSALTSVGFTEEQAAGIMGNMMHEGNNGGKNINVDELNAWTPSNTQTNVPRYMNMNDNQSNSPSTRFLYSATYLKLKNVNLSYSLPKNILKKTGIISGVRFYLNADNLFTVFADKGYKGYDDIDIFGVGGYDAYANYIPLSRTYTLGVNITF